MTDPPMYSIASDVACLSLAIVRSLRSLGVRSLFEGLDGGGGGSGIYYS